MMENIGRRNRMLYQMLFLFELKKKGNKKREANASLFLYLIQ